MRTIGCGPIGAIASAMVASLVFHWQVKRWSRWIPEKSGKKKKNQLLKEYKNTLRAAKALSLAGFLIGLLCYKTGWLGGHDWRGAGIAFGLACFLPVAYIMLANIRHGTERIKEAMTAFVIDQKTPPKVLFVLMVLCFFGGVISVISLRLHPP